MQTTANYGLKKPEGTDVVDIQNFNDNADTIDAELKKINDNAGALSSLNTTAKNTLVAAINEVFQSGADVKSGTISAVNNKGASLDDDATWDDIVAAINAIARGQGNAVESQVLSGITFSNSDGQLRTGNMPNKGAVTITPGIADQVIPAGYHNGSGKVVGDADLKAENIKKGVSIFDIVGALTIESLGGKKWASGNKDTGLEFSGPYTVSSLTFKPSIIFVRCYYVGSSHNYVYTLYNTAIEMLDDDENIISQIHVGAYGSDSRGGLNGDITNVDERGFTYNLTSSRIEYIYWLAVE